MNVLWGAFNAAIGYLLVCRVGTFELSVHQRCLRSDRLSVYDQMELPIADALRAEFERGRKLIASGEAAAGAARFASGQGRHGAR